MLKGRGQSVLVIDKNVANLSRIADRHYIIERGDGVERDERAAIAEPICRIGTWGFEGKRVGKARTRRAHHPSSCTPDGRARPAYGYEEQAVTASPRTAQQSFRRFRRSRCISFDHRATSINEIAPSTAARSRAHGGERPEPRLASAVRRNGCQAVRPCVDVQSRVRDGRVDRPVRSPVLRKSRTGPSRLVRPYREVTNRPSIIADRRAG